METQWIDDTLLISPHKKIIITGETAYLGDCYTITAISHPLHVAILKALQTKAATIAALLPHFFAPYLLTAVEHLLAAGILHNEADMPPLVPVHTITTVDLPTAALYTNENTVITLVDTRSIPAALAVGEATMQAGKYWIPVFVDMGQTFVGPVFQKYGTACPVCLFERMGYHRMNESGLAAPELIPLSLRDTIHAIILKADGDHLHKITRDNNVNVYTLQKRPECERCGNPQLIRQIMESPLQLNQGTTAYRAIPPSATWRRYQHHINPVTGIIKDFFPMGRKTEDGLYAYGAAINGKTVLESIAAYGKGNSDMAARVSCLCEAIERHSAAWRGDEPLLLASLEQLLPLVIAPSDIQHFAPVQLRQPQDTPALGPVPVPVTPDTLINWVPGWSLTQNERRYIPADAVFYNMPHSSEQRPAIFESNGLAAGNTLQEAILQGLLELIERDATAIWWYNQLRRPAAPVALLREDPWFQQAMAQLQDAGWEVTLLDLTIDTSVPVIAAIGCLDGAYLTGYGCHFSMESAMIRALTELIQARAIMGPVPVPDNVSREYLSPIENVKRFPVLTVSGNVEEICQRIIDHLDTLEIETIVVNCSRPDAGLPVVKVFAPGLRSFRPRFGAGRLYEVPVALGLQAMPTPYALLTPMWLTSSRSLPKLP